MEVVGRIEAGGDEGGGLVEGRRRAPALGDAALGLGHPHRGAADADEGQTRHRTEGPVGTGLDGGPRPHEGEVAVAAAHLPEGVARSGSTDRHPHLDEHLVGRQGRW